MYRVYFKLVSLCAVSLVLSPAIGSIAGGSAVQVSDSSAFFDNTENIECSFDGIRVFAVVFSQVDVVCTSPQLSRTGWVLFQLYRDNVLYTTQAQFYSGNIIIRHTLMCFRN